MQITPAHILINIKKELEACTDRIKDGAEFYDLICSSRYFRENDIKVDAGCTRGVIIPPHEDYIIKFNLYSGQDEEDFCAIEEQNYSAAKREGVKDFFAGIHFFTRLKFCGYRVNFYIQEQVSEMIDDVVSDISVRRSNYSNSEEYEEALEEYESRGECNYDGVPYGWADEVITRFGYATYDKVVQFLDAHGINDVHSGNVGFMGRRCVIFDFAGY